jgi:hypothetical protein
MILKLWSLIKILSGIKIIGNYNHLISILPSVVGESRISVSNNQDLYL